MNKFNKDLKMKNTKTKITTTLLLAALTLFVAHCQPTNATTKKQLPAALKAGAKDTQLKIDLKKSQLNWLGKKVTGSHTGTIALKSAVISVNQQGELTSANLVVDMNSIKVTDITDAE